MITFEDWLKLTDEEKKKRHGELSDKDKFKVRQGFYYDTLLKKLDVDTPFMKEIDKLLNDEHHDSNTTL